jgi:hypothetical protein
MIQRPAGVRFRPRSELGRPGLALAQRRAGERSGGPLYPASGHSPANASTSAKRHIQTCTKQKPRRIDRGFVRSQNRDQAAASRLCEMLHPIESDNQYNGK